MSSTDLAPPAGELRMLPDLIRLLRSAGRLRLDTLIAEELAWHGRRVDVATLTRRGVLSAYELKLASFGRVLEQAMYNRLSFDRSWLVVGETPSPPNLDLATRHGIGVIVVNGHAKVLAAAPITRNEDVLRRRLAAKIRATGRFNV